METGVGWRWRINQALGEWARSACHCRVPREVPLAVAVALQGRTDASAQAVPMAGSVAQSYCSCSERSRKQTITKVGKDASNH